MELLTNVGIICGIGVVGIILAVAFIAAVEYRKAHYVCGCRAEWVTFDDGWGAYTLIGLNALGMWEEAELWVNLERHGYSIYGLGTEDNEYLIECYKEFCTHVDNGWTIVVLQED